VRKLILVMIWIFICAGARGLINCSKPLDSNDENGQASGETIVVIDTVVVADTMFCGQLGSHRQEIVWLLQNEEGHFALEFMGETEREFRSQTLLIDIDDQQFWWHLAENSELMTEQELGRDASIRITSIPPHAYGQAIDICLKLEAL
jgi:hypothetical protein